MKTKYAIFQRPGEPVMVGVQYAQDGAIADLEKPQSDEDLPDAVRKAPLGAIIDEDGKDLSDEYDDLEWGDEDDSDDDDLTEEEVDEELKDS